MIDGARIAALRREAGARGADVGDYPATVLAELLERVGDDDLAADALVLRPGWLTTLEAEVSARRAGPA